MGDVEPFREMGSFHFDRGATRKGLHEVGDSNFDVGVCEKASGFNFDMGYCRKALGDGTDVSCAASYAVQDFFELSDAARAFVKVGSEAFCNAGDVDSLCEEDDGSKLDWVSPRISFSQDLTMEEPHNVEPSRSSRGFPEKRKWQGGESGEPDDGCSSDFEFSNDDVVHGSFSHQTKDLMLSADELFLDGKLLPMHTQQTAPSSSAIFGDTSICRSKATLQECHVNKPNLQEAHQKSIDGKLLPLNTQQAASFPASSSMQLTMQECNRPNMPENHQTRHLSLDLPKPISSSIVCELAPLVSLSVDNSPCSSPPRASPVASTTPVSHKAASKYTFRIKDLFKHKRVSSSVNAQLTRDNSTTSVATCRIPIPPRPFWPFSRSNSAGESKTTTPPPPTLPPRSNSAGESNTSWVSPACKNSSKAQVLEQIKLSSTSHTQGMSHTSLLFLSYCTEGHNVCRSNHWALHIEVGKLTPVENRYPSNRSKGTNLHTKIKRHTYTHGHGHACIYTYEHSCIH